MFQKNLRDVLLAPPGGRKMVMGVDPGFRTGVKLAVIDATGKLLEHRTIYPHPPQNQKDASTTILLAMIENFKVEIVAIGNGTASRETDEFIAEAFKQLEKLAHQGDGHRGRRVRVFGVAAGAARSSPISTRPSAAPCPSPAACRIRWPSW